jgi:hypothetical protein
MKGLYLEQVPNIEVDHKIYGGALRRADRIINTFKDRTVSTGVVLQGEKGSGKTLLARILSEQLRQQGVSTILVNTAFAGEAFNTFINQIDQPTMLFFDEFEKVYDMDKQNQLLTLLDGTHRSKKLFVIALNDFYRVNDFMKNRPGRFFYSFKYEGLEEDEIRGYCEDNLNNKSRIDSIVTFSGTFSKFSFDILKAIVEEMNRYDEPISEVVKYLNARPNEQVMQLEIQEIQSKEMKEGLTFDKKQLGPFNPFAHNFTVFVDGAVGGGITNGKKALIAKSIDDDDEDDYLMFDFKPSDLQKLLNGKFVFSNERATVILAKPEPKPSQLEFFYNQL